VIENDEAVEDVAAAKRDHEAEQRAIAYKHRVNVPVDVAEAASEIVAQLFQPKL
jgi:hypothetical protein